VIAVASEQAQNTTLLGYLAALALVAVFVFKRPAAIITMGVFAFGAFHLMTKYVESEGNTINTDAAAHTGPILFGALVGMALHFTVAKRSA
jgi:membrane associated rhomboid family serine protease